jgi:YgiT-type zinc finger domain-containing protein
MTGVQENDRCYFCGGELEPSMATIPFMVGPNVVVIRQVPAEMCMQCGEPVMESNVARVVERLLKQVSQLGLEVSVVTYEQLAPAMA